MSNADCLFCKILAGEIPSTEVYSDERCYAFDDVNPQAPTHTLIIPREHIAHLNELTSDHEAVMGHLMVVASEVAKRKGLQEDGYRLVMNAGEHGGQSVYHLHLHVLGGRQLSWPPG